MRALGAAADRYMAAGEVRPESELIEHGRAYALLLRQHIVKENNDSIQHGGSSTHTDEQGAGLIRGSV